ncbi:MAG: hypothetical protein F6K50_42050 [Moorea sp. SIO3I7]|uniref:hypothetical protein n=1 Tax=Moorena sp. SIO4A5 TaxID=2607838 RepID=UPI0013CAAF2D|nr:hypothetical protein [Moorena sp. SIO4A5]NEO01740.1 hypothetical protein [Moorena sp. SIO3I7]NEO24790.1 hypothetical protein [Moorena sp. SIO4A5]NEO50355.1 hypothetical protein [Moorena sp. SIO4A3]NEO63303.1 hypothetical protein [Moorena sp. SIO4G2]
MGIRRGMGILPVAIGMGIIVEWASCPFHFPAGYLNTGDREVVTTNASAMGIGVDYGK